MPAGGDAIKGVTERIEATSFKAADVQGKYVHIEKGEYVRAFKDKTDVTDWKELDVTNFKKKIPLEHGCEVIGGDGVKFTAT